MLENAIAESMAGNICRCPALWQGRRRPEIATFFVTQIIDLSAWITNRIIAPGSQTELMCIFTPGIGLAALGDDRSKSGIRQDIRPRCRRSLVLAGRDDIFAPIRSKTSETIVEEQFTVWQTNNLTGIGRAKRLQPHRRNR